jgi:Fe-S-cluster containining protein
MKNVRIPLPVRRTQPPLVECTECARCCTYVGVGINAPTSARLATDVLWYLYHENVTVYADADGEWSVMFETRCRNLGDDRLCRVYQSRPHICRGFDNRSCDVNDPSDEALTFSDPREFLAWLEAKKPRLYARVAKEFVPERLKRTPQTRTARAARAVARRAGS